MSLFNKFNPNDIISKAKSTVDNAAQAAKDAAEKVKTANEQSKAEKAAMDEQYTNLANQNTAQIISSIINNTSNESIFDNKDMNTIFTFTKEFYEKIVLPASSVSQTRVSMFPFVPEKLSERFGKNVPMFNREERVIFHIKVDGKQELMLSEKAFYFVLNTTGNEKYLSKGRVPLDKINEMSIEITDKAKFKCNNFVVAEFSLNKSLKEDFISVNEYFNRMKNNNFTITDIEVDKIIREKIGDKISSEIKKYMVYDDELLVYFAWGIDSVTAKDYIVCTNYQIIILDREMFGATSNIKQLYYEDITSALTEQNSKNNDLTGFLLETALTAALKTCDLTISVAGAVTKINTLYKVEAERVVQVYHEFRKLSKQAAKQQNVQVVQKNDIDPLEQLKKLKDLLDMGIITEQEFENKKTSLLEKI